MGCGRPGPRGRGGSQLPAFAPLTATRRFREGAQTAFEETGLPVDRAHPPPCSGLTGAPHPARLPVFTFPRRSRTHVCKCLLEADRPGAEPSHLHFTPGAEDNPRGSWRGSQQPTPLCQARPEPEASDTGWARTSKPPHLLGIPEGPLNEIRVTVEGRGWGSAVFETLVTLGQPRVRPPIGCAGVRPRASGARAHRPPAR